MNELRSWQPLLIVGLLAALSVWVYQQATIEAGREATIKRHDPDAFATDLVLSGFDAKGTLEYRLWADRMQHYPDDDSTELTHPHGDLYRQDGPPWQLQAKQAWIAGGGEEVHLTDSVAIHRDGSAVNKPSDIHTQSLRLWPDRNYAESDVKITYLSTGLRVTSVGMRARLDTGDLELLSQVRGVQAPRQTQ